MAKTPNFDSQPTRNPELAVMGPVGGPTARKSARIPLVGARVSCGGFSSVADDFIERKLDLNEFCIQNPAETYLVRAVGESMAPEVRPGDYLVVDRSLDPADGSLIVGILDGEFALKRLRRVRGHIYLESANPTYRGIEIREGRDFEVWGVVATVIRKYRG